jgi:CRISPR-associated protein (TIGR03985 family)
VSQSSLSLQTLRAIEPLERRTFKQTLRRLIFLESFKVLELRDNFTSAEYAEELHGYYCKGKCIYHTFMKEKMSDRTINNDMADLLLRNCLSKKSFQQMLSKFYPDLTDLELMIENIGSDESLTQSTIRDKLKSKFDTKFDRIKDDLDFFVGKKWLSTSLEIGGARKFTVNNIFNGYNKVIDNSRQLDKPEELKYLADIFNSFTKKFGKPLKDLQRFYIYSDYDAKDSSLNQTINKHQIQLKKIWGNGKASPFRMIYKSASQGDKYINNVYPVCVYYYQRTFYLFAFGYNVAQDNDESSWYSYRFDRITSLEPINWGKVDLKQSLIDKCKDVNDDSLIDEVRSGLRRAYGLDIERKRNVMILRFDSKYYEKYIDGTWRHETFSKFEPGNEDHSESVKMVRYLSRKLLKNEKEIASMFPSDLGIYCKMIYREGDNSVILRLRGWCPVAEVIYPPELRSLMRKEMKKAYEFYENDEETQ